MNKLNNKGFSLVELLITVAIIGIVTGITTLAVTRMINNSKEKGYTTTLNGLKKVAVSYVEENITDITWNTEVSNTNLEYTCIPIANLINDAGYTEKELEKNNINSNGYIKVKRDLYSKSITEEELKDTCS